MKQEIECPACKTALLFTARRKGAPAEVGLELPQPVLPTDESALREAVTPTSIDPDATLDAIRPLWPKPLSVPREVVYGAMQDALDGKEGRSQAAYLLPCFTDAVMAALAEHTTPRETGWLIERRRKGHPVDWARFEESGAVWTTDSTKACRFASREDAEQLAYGEDCHAITEHQWG